MIRRMYFTLIWYFLFGLLLISCGSSSNSSSAVSPNNSGVMTFTPNRDIKITNGSIRNVVFSLVGGVNVENQLVNFSVSDPTIASVSPSSCVVSSGEEVSSSCILTISGIKNGSINLIATSVGYPALSASSTVTDEVQYGKLEIVGESMGAYTALYPVLNNPPYPIYITAKLVDSSGVKDANPLYVSFINAESPGVFEFIPGVGIPQCQLTTVQSTCLISGTLLIARNMSNLSLDPVGAIGGNYASIPVSIESTSKPELGQISVTTQSNSGIMYSGMKAPLFVNWTGFNGADNPEIVTLTINNPNVVNFYTYNGSQYTTSTTKTCTLSAAGYTSCGLGLVGLSNGPATISVSVASSGGGSIPKYNKTVSLVVQSPSKIGRTITFDNNSGDIVELILTSGAANSFVGPNSPTSGTLVTNRGTPGFGSMCGRSNPGAACPIGSVCAAGGANPESNGTYFCYWDQLHTVSGSNTIQAGGSASVFISSSSGITGGQPIEWSGNFHVDKCPAGVCQPLESGIGTGPSFPAVTLAEVTFQHNNIDYYDVSIINGANYAIQFGPTSTTPISTTDAYLCGAGGSFTGQNGGWESSDGLSSAGLPASHWIMTPTESSVVGGVESGVAPSAYFATVTPSDPESPTTCSTNSNCGGNNPVCGWNSTVVTTGVYTFPESGLVCGAFKAWATANQIYGWNESISNLAPFNLSVESVVSPSYLGVTTISVGNLQLCDNSTYSAYGTVPINPVGLIPAPNIMACGGVNWNTLGITRPTGQATAVSSFWMGQVLPTIIWLKQACPTCYTFPYDDLSSTFTCNGAGIGGQVDGANYTVKIKAFESASVG